MKYTNADLFNVLFSPGDKINIRVIPDTDGKPGNRLYLFPDAPLCAEYPDAPNWAGKKCPVDLFLF